jgi:hypothetical protein
VTTRGTAVRAATSGGGAGTDGGSGDPTGGSGAAGGVAANAQGRRSVEVAEHTETLRPWKPAEYVKGVPIPPDGSLKHPYVHGDLRYEPEKRHRKDILGVAHGYFHNGVGATAARVRDFGWWWSGCAADAKATVAGCRTCARYRDGPRGTHLTVGPTFAETTPGAHLAVDLVTITPTKVGARPGTMLEAALVIVCVASRVIWAVPVVDKTAATIANALTDHILREGAPWRLTADNSSEFSASLTRDTLKALSVRFGHSVPWYPQSNSIAENGVKRLVDAIRTLGENHGDSWPTMLQYYCHVINTRRTSTHSLTPFEAYYARTARVMLDGRHLPATGSDTSVTEREVRNRLADARARVAAVLDDGAERRGAAKRRREEQQDRRPVEFVVGTWVRL